MAVFIVLASFVGFVILDLAIRFGLERARRRRHAKERAEALDIGLRLDFTDEANSLKRVEVPNPAARILAVDDEEVVLDSFRKILVMAGYCVDTVETGPEALGLVQKREYDFVFTDLKMPDMDGLDVVKGVKHFRPDVDVIMITGYATIESAVDAMKFGATDYVQKPFTEDELVDFVRKSLIRRRERLGKQLKPSVRILSLAADEAPVKNEFTVPGGYFISKAHCWANVAPSGIVTLGADDFAVKLLGKLDGVELPRDGEEIAKGDPLFALNQKGRKAWFGSPVSGKVIRVNLELRANLHWLRNQPYQTAWICSIVPKNLTEDLQALVAGEDAVQWYETEIARFEQLVAKTARDQTGGELEAAPKLIQGLLQEMDDSLWREFMMRFLSGESSAPAPA